MHNTFGNVLCISFLWGCFVTQQKGNLKEGFLCMSQNVERYHIILRKLLCHVKFRASTEPSISKNWYLANAQINSPVTMSRHNVTAWIGHNLTVCTGPLALSSFIQFRLDGKLQNKWQTWEFFFLLLSNTSAITRNQWVGTRDLTCYIRVLYNSKRYAT